MSTAAGTDTGPPPPLPSPPRTPPGPETAADVVPDAAADTTTAALTAPQLHALFDILTHYETYQEIQAFKDPNTIYSYGTPFVEKTSISEDAISKDNPRSSSRGSSRDSTPTEVVYAPRSNSPLMSMLFNKIALSLPPAKTLPPEFWHVRVQRIISQLGEADLSESYDQGAMGTRKTLATASSALIESVARGALGGYPREQCQGEGQENSLASRTYDTTNAVEFYNAWNDVLCAMVYDDLIDELFTFCTDHENIEDHSPAVKATADYIIIHLAEFVHYVFVLSPNGRYLTKMADSIQRMVPYTLIRQTLRVSNAASMINGMMRLLLAKLSVGGLTNWMGLTSSAEDGMNLLQRIISLVLSYDSSDFKKAADRIEKSKNGPKKAHLAAIKEHLARPRPYHEAVRRESADRGQSMVVAILESVDPSLVASLTDTHHVQLAQYYAALLSIRDRREITNVFCRQNPDLFTQALRDGVAAFDPIIRGIHDKIDLKEHVSDTEGFITEFIDISKGTKEPSKKSGGGEKRVLPTVKDYVELLRRNRHLLYKWIHRVAHNTPDIRDTFRGWAVETIKVFQGPRTSQTEGDANSQTTATQDQGNHPESRLAAGAGAMGPELMAMFGALPTDVQANITPLLDDHVAYLSALDEVTAEKRQALLDKINAPAAVDGADDAASSKQAPSSGRFIASWQELLDSTIIGPATAEGQLRRGRDVAHVTTPGKTGIHGSGSGSGDSSSSNGRSGSPAPKHHTRKHDGFLSGFSSALSSRNPSPEREPTPVLPPSPPPRPASIGPQPPNVVPVVDALGKQFRQFLVERTST